MIYTLTLNPALDYFMDFSGKKMSLWDKTDNTKILYGGKGINASSLFNNFGIENEAIILSGGSTGKMLQKMLSDSNFKYKSFDTMSNTRINVKANFDKTYELGANSINLNKDIESQLIEYLSSKLTNNDTLMIMGSVMKGLSEDIIGKISSLAASRMTKIVFDIDSSKVLDLLRYKPFLIKPNVKELSNYFNVNINSEDDIRKYSRKLIDLGAQNVIVSNDDKGAYLFNEKMEIFTNPIKIKLVNSSGAGDSMLAGFIYRYNIDENYDEALKFGNASGAGTASVMSIADANTIKNLYKIVKNNKLKEKNE